MAEKKSIYLHNRCSSFVAMHVSSDVTEVEAQNCDGSIRRKSFPGKELHHLTFDRHFGFGTSFVSLDSILYTIGGTKRFDDGFEPLNEVCAFDTTQLEDKPFQSFNRNLPSLKERRAFAKVVAVDGKIYAFGGIYFGKQDVGESDVGESVWAEYLEPYSPSPQWKPLSEPPHRIPRPILILLSDRKIFIGDDDITKEGLIYDVNKGCWEKHKLYTGNLPHNTIHVAENPVYVQNNNTLYWHCRTCLLAFDFNTGIFYWRNVLCSLLFGRETMLDTTRLGPILMHLKDDIFCYFTLWNDEETNNVVECIKFRVSKGASKDGEGDLNICLLGYQSHKCDPMESLNCLIPM